MLKSTIPPKAPIDPKASSREDGFAVLGTVIGKRHRVRFVPKEKHPAYAVAAVVIGVALYYAWILEYITLSAASNSSLFEVFINRVIIGAGIIGVMLFAVFFARLLVPLKTRVSVPFLVLAVIGTFIGPYAYLTPIVSKLLFTLGALFVGMEFAWLSLIWSELFGLVDSRCTGYCLALSCTGAAVIYFLLEMLPTLAACILTSCFPVISTVCLVLGFRVLSHDSDAATKAKRFDKKLPGISLRVPWRTSALFGLLKHALVSMAVFGFFFASTNMMFGLSGNEIIGFGGLGVILFAAMVLFPKRLTMKVLYRAAQPVMVLGMLLLALGNASGMVFVAGAFAMLLFLLILTLCEIANRFETPVVRLAGFAFTTSLAACIFGMIAGFVLSSMVASNPTSLGICVGVFIVALCAYCAFASDDGGFMFGFEEESTTARSSTYAGSSKHSSENDPRDMETSRIVFYEAINQQSAALAVEYGLSAREEEVLALIMQGKSIQEVASDLSLSQSTVKTHIHHIYGKMGIQSRGELRALAKLD